MSCVIEITNNLQDNQQQMAVVPEPENHKIREEMEFSNRKTQQNIQSNTNAQSQSTVQTQQNINPISSKTIINPIEEKQKCVSIETTDEMETASLPFKNISKSTQNQFEAILNYKKSSNTNTKYLVFKEINVNTKSISNISQKIKKQSKFSQFAFNHFNDYYFTEKKAMLQSVVESIDYSNIADRDEFKKDFLYSDFYAALGIFAERFQSIFRWNIFFLIFQQLFIQISFIIGVFKFYQYDEDHTLSEQLIIYIFIALSLFTEVFLVKRSRQFLEKEGNDYPFIIAALVQAVSGIMAVSFATVSTPANIQTAAYLLFLLSYLVYILFLSINVLPKFEFLKETFSHFIYTDSK